MERHRCRKNNRSDRLILRLGRMRRRRQRRKGTLFPKGPHRHVHRQSMKPWCFSYDKHRPKKHWQNELSRRFLESNALLPPSHQFRHLSANHDHYISLRAASRRLATFPSRSANSFWLRNNHRSKKLYRRFESERRYSRNWHRLQSRLRVWQGDSAFPRSRWHFLFGSILSPRFPSRRFHRRSHFRVGPPISSRREFRHQIHLAKPNDSRPGQKKNQKKKGNRRLLGLRKPTKRTSKRTTPFPRKRCMKKGPN